MNESINIPVFKPLIESEEIEAAKASLELGWLGMGSYVKNFEDKISEVCDFKPTDDLHVVAVSTGHAALHLSLLMMGVSPGDEVITPSFNNAADFQAIKACGANPIFVDIREDTLCIDTSKIRQLITPKTKCIIAMDYDVMICDHDKLAAISNEYSIPILHDAAHSFGSFYKKRPIGNQHQFTMFSFDPVKTITCIDGGAIVVKGKEYVEKLQAMRLIGMTQKASVMYENSRAWTYDIKDIGYRYHLSNLHAAIGIEQIKKLDVIRKTRQDICSYYYKSLKNSQFVTPPESNIKEVNPFLYYIKVKEPHRKNLREHMSKQGIDTGIHWQAGHDFTFLKSCKRGNLEITERISKQILSIPLHSKMSMKDAARVVEAILSYKKDV